MPVRCDVAVVGGGPAGSTIAAFLARAGLAVVCFERERFPRFHVGESLLPAGLPLFAHYRGARRAAGRLEGHLQAYLFEHGWFWWIPFSDDLTSVGVVLHQRALKVRQGSLEALFEEMVAASPTASSGLAGATRVTPIHRAANFSYRTEPAVGDRFVAIGDAVVFIDPVFSTGVYVAMQSAELAAEVIVRAFRDGEFRAARFDAYRRRVEAGTALLFEFIERYYDPAFLDVFFAPNPPATLKDALTTVFAGGAFLRQPLWLRARLECVRLAVRRARWLRRRRGQPVESQLSW